MKSYVLYLSVCSFYVRALLARNPGWEGSALVVHRDRMVLDASDEARRLGVAPGSPLKLARVLAGGHGRLVDAAQEDFRAESEAWLDRCVRYSSFIEPEGESAAWLDLSLHPQPEWVARSLIDELESFMPLRWGAGRSKWLARVSAQIEGSRSELLESSELAELPVEMLAPIAPEARDRLKFLGCRRIKDLLVLGPRVLREQFGEEGMRIRKAAEGWLVEPIEPLYPPRSLQERFVFDGPVNAQEELDRGIRALAERLGARLQARSLQGSRAAAVLELEEGIENRERATAKPLVCAATCLPALRQLFGEPWPGPVAAIQAVLPDLVPARSVQPSLADARSSQTERSPKVEAAVSRLKGLYGAGSVLRAGEVALPRRRQVLKMWEEALGWR